MVVALSLALQAIAVLAVAALTTAIARRAAMRHALWTGGVVGSLLIPVAALVLPTIRVAEPALLRTTIVSVVPERGVAPAAISPPAIDPLKDLRPGEKAPATINWALIIWMTWAAGAIASLCVIMRRAWRIHVLLRAARPITTQGLLGEWASLLGKYSLRRSAGVLLGTSDMIAPATCGLFRARVLLPANTDGWSQERVRAVLAHELAHVARRDCLTQTAAQIASALYWFSPLHRHAERMMAVERERACDEFVLRTGLAGSTYARALVDAKRDALSFRPDPFLLAMAPPDRSELENRVAHILESAEPDRVMGPLARLAVVTLVLSAVVVTSTVRLEAAPPPGATRAGAPQGMEPDQRRDSVSLPASERIGGGAVPTEALTRALLAGPDSMLARHLVNAIERVPKDDEDLVRERARWALVQSADGHLVEPLIGRLADDDWRVRAYAAWALGAAQDPRATMALIAQMDHPVWRLRAMAAYALQSIGDIRARDAMLRALGDPAWQVRAPAVSYLGALREPALTPVIRARLSDRHIAVQMAAQRALEQ
jgi:beta-lactamase regulating signal transducer with metallopeptidase domain